MKYVLSFNSYKESLSAVELCDIAEKALKSVDSSAKVYKLPIGDGGDGTMQAMVSAGKGKIVKIKTVDPLFREIEAEYGLLNDGETAVIEMAKASGLALLSAKERDPLKTTTLGTGFLIKDAIARGCKEIIVGIGGSATTDGGLGVAQALGYRLMDENDEEIDPTGEGLMKLRKIIAPQKIDKIKIRVACDVDNPLYGNTGAAYVYAPQKGANRETVKILDSGLQNFAKIAKRDLGMDISRIPGAGAAGGLGAGLVLFAKGKLVSGVDLVLKTLDVEKYVKKADLVFSGEGAVDEQTAYGKAPAGIAKLAKKHGKPCLICAGAVKDGAEKLHSKGVSGIFSITPGPVSLDESMKNAGDYFYRLISELARFHLQSRKK